MTSTDPLNLDAIEARANAATPGPWEEHPDYGKDFYAYLRGPYLRGVGTLNFGDGEDAAADREFVKHARTDVDAVVAEARRLRAELAAAGTPAQLPGGFKRTTVVTVDCAACGYHFDEGEFIHAFDSVEEAVDNVVAVGWDELRDGRVICEDRDEKHEALRSEVGVVNDSDEA